MPKALTCLVVATGRYPPASEQDDSSEAARLDLLQGLAVDGLVLPGGRTLSAALAELPAADRPEPADATCAASTSSAVEADGGVDRAAAAGNKAPRDKSLAIRPTMPTPPSRRSESEGSRHYQLREEYRACVETPGHHVVARVTTPGHATSRSSPMSTARFLGALSPLGTARHYFPRSQRPSCAGGHDDDPVVAGGGGGGSDPDSVMSMYDSFCADLVTHSYFARREGVDESLSSDPLQ